MAQEMILSILGGRVKRYLFEETPSELIPFKGDFPILQEYQAKAYSEEIKAHDALTQCADWVQKAVVKGDKIFVIDSAFRKYLSDKNMKAKFDEMDAPEKADVIVKFLEENQISFERLTIR